MNYNRYIKKRKKLIDEIKKSITNEVDVLNYGFNIQNIDFTQIYKEDDVLMVVYNNSKNNYFLDIYIYIDYIKLDISQTKFTYTLYRKDKKEIDNYFSKNINYADLQGNSINEKINSLYYDINKQIELHLKNVRD